MSKTKLTNSTENCNFPLPLVSIIIDNYNYGRFLAEAINSAINQTYPNIEIIVVDDGSTDNSPDIIKSYQDQVIPILKSNGGQASAFNAGFAVSQGEIICFLDSDDIFFPEKVEKIVNIFMKHKEIGWCCHFLKFFGKDIEKNQPNKKLESSKLHFYSGIYDLRSTIKKGKFSGTIPPINLSIPNICFRRSLLKQILPMPETVSLKTSDEYIKFTALGLTPGFILLEELSLQRIHDNNAYTGKSDQNKQKLNAKINIFNAYWMKKNFPLIMSKFSNNIFAIGIGLYWFNGGVEPECQSIVNSYLESLNLLEKLEIYIRIFYNYIKLYYTE